MRRSIGFALAFVSLLLLGATIVSYSKYKKSVAEYQQVTAQEESTRVHYDRAVNEIVVIQDSLNAIVMGPNAASLAPDRYQLELQGPATLHDESLARIAMLKSAIERTKKRIEELDAKLKKNGVRMAGLESMIVGLRKSVTEKEERIAELSTQVDTLGVRVAGLTTQVEAQRQDIDTKQAEIARKREEIATVFYAMGTKSELTNAGIVASKGGVLGLGKTLKPSGAANPAAFTPLDTDQETVIRVPAAKVQVLSAQNVASYVLQPVGENMVEIRIVNPEEFRKVKQVIILKT